MEITSVQNSRVKEWAELLTRRGRDKQKKVLLEGEHLVIEALNSGIAVESVLYLAEKGIPFGVESYLTGEVERIAISQAVLAKCSDTETPQGVLAVARRPELAAEVLLDNREALIVALDGVQDPGNLGTIIRTADAAGATGIVLGRGTVDPYNPKTMRSAMGSLFHLPVVEASLPQLLQQAAAGGAKVYSTGMSSGLTCYAADLSGPVWFVLGNEGAGVSAEVRGCVQQELSIPMPGKAESLNVAMAGGILLYEALRQRRFAD
ncbi:TrmH family RNA methyltransferase [Gorillibacterium massiliense]|uniref:TrmH family RNA methyltransferase n=1 Tax=Gorillibacterium massiliense TaxID=1280390 RepID=UPI00192E6B42|nr:RNA methyltransferase [Gorillibacterium massiliense]